MPWERMGNNEPVFLPVPEMRWERFSAEHTSTGQPKPKQN
jgi:hypothetical protein